MRRIQPEHSDNWSQPIASTTHNLEKFGKKIDLIDGYLLEILENPDLSEIWVGPSGLFESSEFFVSVICSEVNYLAHSGY
jgi:hypothetical protein